MEPAAPPAFAELCASLRARLAAPLPGLPAQLEMAPRPRRSPAPGIDPGRPRPAGVLALLFPADPAESTLVAPAAPGEPCLLLTRRTERVSTHRRQVSFPGGALAAGERPLDSALREAQEEVGVAAAALEVLGALTPVFIPVSGYRIEPFVARALARPRFTAAPAEVDALLEVPLRLLLEPGRRAERPAVPEREGESRVIPYFALAGEQVWGATAMVLAELAALLAELRAPR